MAPFAITQISLVFALCAVAEAFELCPADGSSANDALGALSLLQTQARLRSAAAALSEARREAILQQTRDLATLQSAAGVGNAAGLSEALKRASELSAVLDWDEPPAWTLKNVEPKPNAQPVLAAAEKGSVRRERRAAVRRAEEDEDEAANSSEDPLLQEIMSYDWDKFDAEEKPDTKSKGQTSGNWEEEWDEEYHEVREQSAAAKTADAGTWQERKAEKKESKAENMAARQSDIEERLKSEAKAIMRVEDEQHDNRGHEKQQETVVPAESTGQGAEAIEKVYEERVQEEKQQERPARREEETSKSAPKQQVDEHETEQPAADEVKRTPKQQKRPAGNDEGKPAEQTAPKRQADEHEKEQPAADDERMKAAKATARHVHELSTGFALKKNSKCGECGDGNDAAIAKDGSHYEYATRETAQKVCGAACAANHDCGGFNFVESLSNCYYRKTTTCQQNVDEDRDCFTKAGAPPFRVGDATAPLPPIADGGGADVLGASAAAMAPRLDGIAAELDRMRDALGRSGAGWAAKAMPPLGFVKTHRTGSSTVINILQRLGEARNLTFLMPPGGKGQNAMSLGWPDAFPGPDAAAVNGPPMHQFDVICHASIYDDEEMRAYLKPLPLFFTVLRRPSVQISSAFTTYKPPAGETWDKRMGWLERLWLDDANFTMLKLGDRGPQIRAQFMNPQAHDLGWYERAGNTALFDQDDAAISAWINELKLSLGFVMLTEYFDEGLVLLGRRLGLQATDLAHILHNRGQEVEAAPHSLQVPTKELLPGQAKKVEDILHVDTLLYGHFNRTFWQAWETAGGHAALGDELEELRRRNILLETACAANDVVVCPWSVKAKIAEFTEYVKKREAERSEGASPIMF